MTQHDARTRPRARTRIVRNSCATHSFLVYSRVVIITSALNPLIIASGRCCRPTSPQMFVYSAYAVSWKLGGDVANSLAS